MRRRSGPITPVREVRPDPSPTRPADDAPAPRQTVVVTAPPTEKVTAKEDPQAKERARVERRRRRTERLLERTPTAWGAILAGALVAFALLASLGLLGLTFFGAQPGWGAAVWVSCTALLSFLAGGWLAGRLSGTRGRGAGALHGLVVWGLVTAFAVLLTAIAFVPGQEVGP